jgi:hypothetical protein
MIKIFLTFAIISLAGPALSQQVIMTVHLADGKTHSFDVDSIESMHGTGVDYPKNRIVQFYEYYREFSSSASLDPGGLSFMRSGSQVYLKTPAGWGTRISGQPDPPPASFTEGINFDLLSKDENIYSLLSSQERPDYMNTSWSKSGIYAGVSKPWKFLLDSNDNVISQQALQLTRNTPNAEVNVADTKMAFLAGGRYSSGILELDLLSGLIDTLTRDSFVNSMRYDESNGDLIYYSLGSYDYNKNPMPEDAGYYRYDRTSRTTSFIIRHIAEFNDGEAWDGFDISHDGKKLLLPFPARYHPGQIELIEYDLETKVMDTLPIEFEDPRSSGNSFWTQYSHNDSLILYSISDRWMTGASKSQVGIYDRHAKTTTPVIIAPNNQRPFSAPYPRWSPNDKAICYGGCEIPDWTLDYIGPFKVYIKPLKP